MSSAIHQPPRVAVDLTLQELLEVCRGQPQGPNPPQRFGGVTADSRAVEQGDLFLCLKTESGDGHQYAADAFRRGAGAALVAGEEVVTASGPLIAVADPWKALAQLARARRRRHRLPLFAVTGSNGKTTTRSLLTAILAQRGKCLSPQTNWNNRLGLSLTLLRLDETYRLACLELGMNHFGEIKEMAEICLPDFGLITNVAPVHLEFLGSLEGVARAKEELFQNLPAQAIAVVNLDDPLVAKMRERRPGPAFTFSMKQPADLRGRPVAFYPRAALALLYQGRELTVELPFAGAINGQNALAAAATALAGGFSLDEVGRGLHRGELPAMRLQEESCGGITLLLDCYNANPASMKNAIAEALRRPASRHVLLLGDMLELGASSEALHREIGAALAAQPPARCFLYGPRMKAAAEEARSRGLSGELLLAAEDPEILAKELAGWLAAGDLLLVKGSRGMKMETIVARWQALRAAAEGDN